MKRFSLAILLACSSCTNYMSALKDGRFESNVALREMNYEIEELKVSLQQAHIEINALEDRIQSQERELFDLRPNARGSDHIAALERRVEELKAAQKSALSDLNSLNAHANKTTSSLTGYRDKIQNLEKKVASQDYRLGEVVKLKQTLSSISRVMKTPKNTTNSSTYRVVAGDTLGKIALHYHTSVRKIKELNNLSSNRIIVGQKLLIPQ